MTVAELLNTTNDADLQRALSKCCASPTWIDQMLARRPFESDTALAHAASDVWWSLDADEWLKAFSAHPKIGDLDSLQTKFANTANWASTEQAGVALAREETLRDLAEFNRQYEERFGYIFIVCATGMTAEEILTMLKQRLKNKVDVEIRIAAAEQIKITLLRLGKLGT